MESGFKGQSRQWNRSVCQRRVEIIVKLGLDYVIAKVTASKALSKSKAANKRMSDRNRIWQLPEQRRVKCAKLVIIRIKE